MILCMKYGNEPKTPHDLSSIFIHLQCCSKDTEQPEQDNCLLQQFCYTPGIFRTAPLHHHLLRKYTEVDCFPASGVYTQDF